MNLKQMCHFGSLERRDYARSLMARINNSRAVETGPLYSSPLNGIMHARVAFPLPCHDPWAHVGKRDLR